MSEGWRQTAQIEKIGQQPAPEDPLSNKLWREARLLTQGFFGGIGKGFSESANDLPGTALRAAEVLAINVILARSQHSGGAVRLIGKAAGAYLCLNFANDVLSPRRWGSISSSIADTWTHADNLNSNIGRMQDDLGRFAFDTSFMLGVTMLNPRIIEFGRNSLAPHFQSRRIEKAMTESETATSCASYLERFDAKSTGDLRSPALEAMVALNPKLKPGGLEPAAPIRPTDGLLLPFSQSLETWSSAERGILLRELQKQSGSEPLGERDNGILVSLLKQHTTNWSRLDLSPLREQYLTARYEYLVADHHLRSLWKGEPADLYRSDIKRDFTNSQMKEAFTDTSRLRAALDSVWHKINPHYIARADALRGAYGDFARYKNLPRPTVEISDAEAYNGTHFAGRAHIWFGAKNVVQPGPSPFLVEVARHEFKHFEQDVLCLRKLADELNIGRRPTKDQAERLTHLYKQRSGNELSDHLLTDVMQIRDGQKLSAAEQKRADKLLESSERWSREDTSNRLDTGWEDLELLRRQAAMMDRPNEGLRLANRLQTGRDLLEEAMFAIEPPSPELLAWLSHSHQVKQSSKLTHAWDEAGAKLILSEHMNRAGSAILTNLAKPRLKYLDLQLEREAFADGLLAHIKSRAMGLEIPSQKR
jgi:hypothetical protein